MSRSKRGTGGGAAPGRRVTIVFEWQTRVVIRSSTGSCQRSRQLERGEREVVGLLRVGRLEHRQARGDRVAAVVLLVLARRHARIVGGDDHERARDAGVGGGEERVGGDVQPDVLHRDERARAGERGAEPDLERDLLVRRPLRAAAERRERLEDLGRGRAGIAGAEVDAAVPGRGRHRLVTGKKPSFHRSRSPQIALASSRDVRGASVRCTSRPALREAWAKGAA